MQAFLPTVQTVDHIFFTHNVQINCMLGIVIGVERADKIHVQFWVLKLNSGLGQVITMRNIFVSSFFHNVKSHYILIINKHVIVYEYVLHCLFTAATLKDNISHNNKKNVN